MNRHKADPIAVLRCIRIGKQRYACKIGFERGLFATGGFEFVNGLFELRKVVKPVLRTLCAQHCFIAALIQ